MVFKEPDLRKSPVMGTKPMILPKRNKGVIAISKSSRHFLCVTGTATEVTIFKTTARIQLNPICKNDKIDCLSLTHSQLLYVTL